MTEQEQLPCHVIVRASNEIERANAETILRELRLDPREVWSTGHAVSYAVSSTDTVLVRQALAQTSLGWTVVPPGQPDYPLRELTVQAPDGARYRIVGAPSQQTVRSIADEIAEEHGSDFFGDTERRPIFNHIGAGTPPAVLNPDYTLYDANVSDGDELQVAFEVAAGGLPAPQPATGEWVFLCHCWQDKNDARELYRRLAADGLRPWLDEENLLPGQDWRREISKAIKDNSAVLVLLSNFSVTKTGHVQREIRTALDVADSMPEEKIFLIPSGSRSVRCRSGCCGGTGLICFGRTGMTDCCGV